jgi:hypothetical protein
VQTRCAQQFGEEGEIAVQPVSLRFASAGTEPTSTGSHSYFASFSVLVDNLAFDKQVSILAHDGTGWNFHTCAFSASTPDNGEIWTAQLGSPAIDQFVVAYQVLGQSFWDNNGAANYLLDIAAAESKDGTNTVALNANVLVEGYFAGSTGILSVNLLLRDLNSTKQVGLVYTTDGWTTFHTVSGLFQDRYAPFSRPSQPNAESWQLSAPVGIGQHGQFAVFYSVNGTTFWDNNFGVNYHF